MLWAIHRAYKPDMTEMRATRTEEHRAYLLKCKDILMFTGQLQSDDGTQALGAWLVVNVRSRADAQAFLDADPFAKAGMLPAPRSCACARADGMLTFTIASRRDR